MQRSSAHIVAPIFTYGFTINADVFLPLDICIAYFLSNFGLVNKNAQKIRFSPHFDDYWYYWAEKLGTQESGNDGI
jgi:hypothetical protein